MPGLATRLHSVAIHLLRRVRTEDAAARIGPARLSALSVLVFGGARTLGELAAAEQVRPPTMTRIVAALEAEGLVAREADARDRRVARVRATEAGVQLMLEARDRRVARLESLVGELTPAERAALEEGVSALERALRRG